MEPQNSLNSQSNPEKKESWRHNTSRLQIILYSNQNSMVLAQKQTYGPMEQNRDKPTHIWSPYL